MTAPGSSLRMLREKLGLSMRDVEAASERLVRKHHNPNYLIMTGGLSDFETNGVTPGVHQLYSLAIIYRLEFTAILSWYGVDLNQTASDLETSAPPRTHLSQALPNTAEITKPIRIDPSFDPHTTSNFAPMIKQWGTVPLAYLRQLAEKDYGYGYIGSEDLTMDPLLPPGSFVQVDESRTKVLEGAWRSEYYRPIYLVETREGYTCSWCTQSGKELILIPHPLSPARPKVLPSLEADVIGQVVGVAMRVDHSRKGE
jgi:hypothetical protein